MSTAGQRARKNLECAAPPLGEIIFYPTLRRKKGRKKRSRRGVVPPRSALALFMALVLGTDNHNLAVPFDYLALIAHRLYRRSNFHNKSPFGSRNSRAGRARQFP